MDGVVLGLKFFLLQPAKEVFSIYHFNFQITCTQVYLKKKQHF